jgi:ketosteroid isomerase-like protein
MSQENVEIVQTALAAWSRGDLDAVVALADPNLEYRTSGAFPGLRTVYHGREGFVRFSRDFRDPWEEIIFTPERVVDVADKVAVLGRFEARGRDGIAVGKELGFVFTLRDGLARSITAHTDWTETLAGLESHDEDARSGLDEREQQAGRH